MMNTDALINALIKEISQRRVFYLFSLYKHKREQRNEFLKFITKYHDGINYKLVKFLKM